MAKSPAGGRTRERSSAAQPSVGAGLPPGARGAARGHPPAQPVGDLLEPARLRRGLGRRWPVAGRVVVALLDRAGVGHDLAQVLRVLDKALIRAVD